MSALQIFQRQLAIETFEIQCQALGLNAERGKQLSDEAIRAWQESVYSWPIVEIMIERLHNMLVRGDSFGQALEWIKSCPTELEYTWRAEALIPDFYPGGPGQQFK